MAERVGIMTLYHKTYNYGAQLQAYALQKTVEKLGYECEVINFQWSGIKTVMYYESAGKNVGRFRDFSREIPHSVRLYTPYDIDECADEYDIFICGSDQIWGANLNMPIFVLPKITLSFVPAGKVKIAYAASMGGSAVSERIRDALAPYVARLDAVSVRENSAAPFVSQMAGKEAVVALDPTMLLPTDAWREIAVAPNNTDKYILVYNIGQNPGLDSTAETLSQRLDCDIVSLSYSDNDTAGPKEFLGLIDNAEFVLTNSFHGTVFSILFRKQFLAFGVDTSNTKFSKNIRIVDLLENLNLSKRYVGRDTTKIERLLDINATIDFDLLENTLINLRNNSLNFLSESLRLKKNTKFGEVRKKRSAPQADYLAAIANISSAEKMLYENMLIEQYFEHEKLLSDLYCDNRRILLTARLNKFISFGLTMNAIPQIKGKVIIYGARHNGQLALRCFDRDVICFVDKSEEFTFCKGLPVYRLKSNSIKQFVSKYTNITFFITPVRDSEELFDEIRNLYSAANIVTAEEAVKDLWI
jgi:hypothetical protein